MPTEHPERTVSGVESLTNLAGAQAIRKDSTHPNFDNTLPETEPHRNEEDKNADVIPEDFETFNLDAIDKLKESVKEDKQEE